MSTPREQLAAALKQSRLDAGAASQAVFAKRLHISRPVVTKAENPLQPVPTDAVLQAWAEQTGAAAAELYELARRCKSGAPEWFTPFALAEHAAATLRYWSPLVIPGVLQTLDYARAVLGREPHPPGRLEELLKARVERQQVLERAYVTAVFGAGVLHCPMGGAVVMAEQCAHLLAVAALPNVTLLVVPEHAGVGVQGGFDIASSDGQVTVNMLGLRDVSSTESMLADHAVRAFEHILGSALPCDQTLEHLTLMEEKWKAQL